MNFNRIEQYVGGSTQSNGNANNKVVEAIKPTLEKVGDAVTNAVRQRPAVGVAVGLAIGVAIGCFIKRR